MDKLTPRQKAFCEQYIIDFNGARAARDSGYSEKVPSMMASKLLSKPHIQTYLKQLMSERAERVNLTQDRVVKELMAIAFCDVRDFYCDITGELLQPHELDERAAKAVHGFTSVKKTRFDNKGNQKGKVEEIIDEYKRLDKIKALEMLGRHLGLFEKDNKQSQPVTKTKQVQIVRRSDEN